MSTQPLIRVLIVDDQEMVRSGLEMLFEICDDLQLVGSTGDTREALRLCCEQQPHIVLMDLMLSGKPAEILAARAIRAAMPQVRVIALSCFSSLEIVEEAFRAGITGYLVKTVSIDELAQAIREIYEGKTVISPEIAVLLQQLRNSLRP